MYVGAWPDDLGTVDDDTWELFADLPPLWDEHEGALILESGQAVESGRSQPGQDRAIARGQQGHPQTLLVGQWPRLGNEYAMTGTLPATAGQPPAHCRLA
jgi:hypothetical protein